jgi:hypothetical protein
VISYSLLHDTTNFFGNDNIVTNVKRNLIVNSTLNIHYGNMTIRQLLWCEHTKQTPLVYSKIYISAFKSMSGKYRHATDDVVVFFWLVFEVFGGKVYYFR